MLPSIHHKTRLCHLTATALTSLSIDKVTPNISRINGYMVDANCKRYKSIRNSNEFELLSTTTLASIKNAHLHILLSLDA